MNLGASGWGDEVSSCVSGEGTLGWGCWGWEAHPNLSPMPTAPMEARLVWWPSTLSNHLELSLPGYVRADFWSCLKEMPSHLLATSEGLPHKTSTQAGISPSWLLPSHTTDHFRPPQKQGAGGVHLCQTLGRAGLGRGGRHCSGHTGMARSRGKGDAARHTR